MYICTNICVHTHREHGAPLACCMSATYINVCIYIYAYINIWRTCTYMLSTSMNTNRIQIQSYMRRKICVYAYKPCTRRPSCVTPSSRPDRFTRKSPLPLKNSGMSSLTSASCVLHWCHVSEMLWNDLSTQVWVGNNMRMDKAGAVMEAADVYRCIYVYIYMYACIYVLIHINIYKHIHARMYVCIQTCLCTNIHVYIDIYRYK